MKTDFWHPQRFHNDAATAILKSFIYHLRYPISKQTIESAVEQHPEYPGLSVRAFISIFREWEIDASHAVFTLMQLSRLTSPCLVIIDDVYAYRKRRIAVMYTGMNEHAVRYLHPAKGWVYDDIEDFSSKWSNSVIITGEMYGKGEPDYRRRDMEYFEQIAYHPEIGQLDELVGFLTAKQCAHVIDLAEAKYYRNSLVSDPDVVEQNGKVVVDLSYDLDKVLFELREQLSELTSIPCPHFEIFQFWSLEGDQDFPDPHYYQNPRRKCAIQIYLNDDFEGGQLYFPNLDMLCSPIKGDALLLHLIDDDGQLIVPNYKQLPVSRGKKCVLNVYAREAPIS